ncbi:MAG: TetR/AcrR family transcriptional regulator [Bradymonadia bacterium]
MPRPKLRNAALKATVLETALKLLEAEGEAACTTRRIARLAHTSPPAIYELFGDKEGLIRALFFEGFRMLGERMLALPERDDPRANLEASMHAFRAFAHDHPALGELMFSRPFMAFVPDQAELHAGDVMRRFLLKRVRQCIDAGVLAGDDTDIAHSLLAVAIGLATQERAGWLGSSTESMARRWSLSISALLDGLAPRD